MMSVHSEPRCIAWPALLMGTQGGETRGSALSTRPRHSRDSHRDPQQPPKPQFTTTP